MNSLKGCRLTILRKNGKCTLFKPENNSIKIGSDITNNIRFRTPDVKALHCKIVKNSSENEIFIINYCKVNPVKVNNEIVLTKASLNNGDVIEIHNTQMKWQNSKIKSKEKWTDAVLTGRLSESENYPAVKSLRKKVRNFFFLICCCMAVNNEVNGFLIFF